MLEYICEGLTSIKARLRSTEGSTRLIINIQDDILKIQSLGLLDKMLIDKTTKRNIMWATDAYSSLGKAYERNEEIFSFLITGRNSDVIKTRARKAMEQQAERTKKHAEVFTPLWICNKMNNHVDEVWFGSADVFNKNGIPTERIPFENAKDWQKYVDSRKLEITCGEAPYLVSRYDVATGEMIPIPKRIGILDRKLRVVNENTDNEKEWLKWALRAFQATYGYEFQGDNVLISRVNMLMTYEEYLRERFSRKPTGKEYGKILNVIVWNIWQMDGLTGTIPYSTAEEDYTQMTIFDVLGNNDETDHTKKANRQPKCRIYDWRGKCSSIEFMKMKNE